MTPSSLERTSSPALRLILLGLSLVFVTGCMNIDSTLTIRPDGSGEIHERVIIGPEFVGMIESMQAMDTTQSMDEELFSEEDIREREAYPGSELSSVTMIDDARGKGYESVYTFSDIRQVTFEPQAGDIVASQMSDQMGDQAEGDPEEEMEGMMQNLDMQFSPGSPATLTVRFPRDEDDTEEDELDDAEAASDTSEVGPQEMRMLQMMFRDARFRMAIEVDGTIVETSASHTDGQTVTLFDLNFGEMVQDTTALRRFMEFGDADGSDPEDIANLPGVTVETKEEITISFE